ncbi:hypothetical protein IIU_06854 [Bacillus cereus VD133]|uniref:Quercetin 2,3-dioxygenase C-terminal cupin domain-containing protein n=1 Tax=Bacillus cereus VD133 TaxID=1053233 RepID=A0A9W5PJF0_BACCE|nr:hypothetical protein [Bacillus cereus]EOO24067.1 hypothetical protein IIU_06854 [Bacillus cereus VD133]
MNLIAGFKQIGATLELRQQVAVYDVHSKSSNTLDIPKIKSMTPWLYVMDGGAEVDNNRLDKGDAVTGKDDTALVLFL